MSSYHTQALIGADIFTVMGSIYAEVGRYDSAVQSGQSEQALQAAERAQEIINFAQSLRHINKAQKLEIKMFDNVFKQVIKKQQKSKLDDYLLPFAVAARKNQ